MTHDGLRQRLAAALACHRRGELAAARALYHGILRTHPRCVEALYLLGVLCTDAGGTGEGAALLREGLACLDQAVALQPDFPDAWLTRGNALQVAGALQPAIASYREAVRQRPEFPVAFSNLAAAERAARQLGAALASADRALQLQPAYAKALNNRGLVLLDLGRAEAAVADFRAALAADARFPEALHNLGTALMQLRRFGEAGEAFADLAAGAPEFPHVPGNLLLARLNCCDWRDHDTMVAAVRDAVVQGRHAVTPMTLLYVADDPALQKRCATLFCEAYYPARGPQPAFGRARGRSTTLSVSPTCRATSASTR